MASDGWSSVAETRDSPLYATLESQQLGDNNEVVFEFAPEPNLGERTVHFEKTIEILNEQEMQSLGLKPSNGYRPWYEADDVDEGLKQGARELEHLRQLITMRARSASPGRSSLSTKTILFGSVDEINQDDESQRQEFYAFRDSQQGKPLPGDNEYGTWGNRFDDKERQWKLRNGQWVRAVAKRKPLAIKKCLPRRVRSVPPIEFPPEIDWVKMFEPQEGSKPKPVYKSVVRPVAVAKPIIVEPAYVDLDIDLEPPEPMRRLVPQADTSWIKEPSEEPDSGSTTSGDYADGNGDSSGSFPPALDSDVADLEPPSLQPRRSRHSPVQQAPPDVDLIALRDKYKSKPAHEVEEEPKHISPPSGTILRKSPKQEIKLEPAKPIYVEIKEPIKTIGDEEKLMEDPNLMWMRMGPTQYGPPFGTLGRRKAREEEWFGPACELCHKQIEERRCMLAESRKFHCWHFSCSFCLKTLKPADFLIAEADNKPYCLNCHKREFPEVSLMNLRLDKDGHPIHARENVQPTISSR